MILFDLWEREVQTVPQDNFMQFILARSQMVAKKKKKKCIYQLMLSALMKFSPGFTKVEKVERPLSQKVQLCVFSGKGTWRQ